jgi:hypothetical protein
MQCDFSPEFFVALAIAVLLSVSIWQSRIKKSKYFTAFWVESIPIVWFLLLVLCT